MVSLSIPWVPLGLGGENAAPRGFNLMRQSLAIFSILAVVVLFNTQPLHAAEDQRHGFTIARLKYGGGGDWYNDPSLVPNMLKELAVRARVVTDSDQIVVDLTDERLFNYPFLFLTGHGNIKFTDEEAERLRLYVEHGGFLYADDDYGMDQAFRREMKRIFPESPLVELPFTHPIYHSHYQFPNGLPKIHEHDNKPPRGYGIFLEKRLVVFYTYESNISDGWVDTDVYHDPPEKREEAFRMGTNIIVYFLTGQ
jgi:hypothetical protein